MRFEACLLVSTVLAAFPVPALAQVHDLWIQSYDGDPLGFEYATSVALAPDGSVVAAGSSGASASGDTDFLVLRFDPSGLLLWSRRFDLAGGNDRADDVVVDPADGSLYVVGRAVASGQNVPLTLKYDAAGTLLWTASGPGPGVFARAALTSTGALVAAGTDLNELLVVERDPLGGLTWATLVPGTLPGFDVAGALAIDPAGNIVVGGRFNGSTSTSDAGVAKLTAGGTWLWTREIDGGGPGLETVGALAFDGEDAIHAAGNVQDPATGSDGLLARLDGAGNVLWTRTFAGSVPPGTGATDRMSAVGVAPNGRVRAAGEAWQANGQSDIRVFEYMPNGNLVWQQTWDGPAGYYDAPFALTNEPDGSLTVAGATRLVPSGQYDPVLLRYDLDGTLLWQHELPLVAAGQPTSVFEVASGPDGSRVFAGRDNPTPGSPTDVVVVRAQDQSVAFCFGDGAAPCPCANTAPVGEGRGCLNSLGTGARLVDHGLASLSADSLELVASGVAGETLSVFLQGAAVSGPTPFGDGLLCLGRPHLRLYARNSYAGTVIAPRGADPAISARSAELGAPISPGETRTYQVYYRDASAGFCPGGGMWNTSSARAVLWAQ